MNFKKWLVFLEGSNVYGWITPSKRFVPTNAWGHYEEIGHDEELKRLVPNYDNELENLKDMENQCKELGDQGEHPEWHRYEVMEYDLRRHAIKSLYKAGCIRVGSVGDIMHFEGAPGGISNLFQFCKDFAEDNSMVPKFEPIK